MANRLWGDPSVQWGSPPVTWDGFASLPDKVVNDQVSVTDTGLPQQVVTVWTVPDPVGVSDARVVAFSRPVAVADPVGVSDAVSVTRPARTVPVDDVAGVSDTVIVVRSAAVSVGDPVGVSDGVGGQAGVYTRTIGDTVGVSDAAGRAAVASRGLSDPLGATDTQTAVRGFTRAYSDPVGVTDAASAPYGPQRAAADLVRVTDLARVANRTNVRTIGDAVGVTDRASSGRPDVTNDDVGVTDAVTAVRKRPPRPDLGPLFTREETLRESRLTRFQFDVLDNDENGIGTLNGAVNGQITWQQTASIHGGGRITVQDVGQNIDWLNVRIRPSVLISRAGGGDDPDPITTYLGVFLPSAPVEQWTDLGRSWEVELLDKCSILDQDIPVNLLGDPITYVAPAGANVIQLVVDLINETGEETPAILPDTKTLPSALVWDVGTTRLKIINDLLTAADYFSLWCDGQGQFQTTPYVEPVDRTPVYEEKTPFSRSDWSLMDPEWSHDRDIYAIPNRYVAISQGDGANAALVAVATNEDPASPYSFQSRGRWITRTVSDVEVVSQAELDALARRGLTATTSIASAIELNHLFLPDLLINSTVRFVNDAAGLDMLCYVAETTVTFDPVALCSSTFREATV